MANLNDGQLRQTVQNVLNSWIAKHPRVIGMGLLNRKCHSLTHSGANCKLLSRMGLGTRHEASDFQNGFPRHDGRRFMWNFSKEILHSLLVRVFSVWSKTRRSSNLISSPLPFVRKLLLKNEETATSTLRLVLTVLVSLNVNMPKIDIPR